MVRRIVSAVLVSAAVLSAVVFAANDEKEQAAAKDAQAWLGLVDNGQYSESWEKASQYFKSSVQEGQWEQSVKGVRDPLGKVVSREVKTTQYMTTMPGAPDGEYVVVQLATSFENKKEAIETVTPMLDKDGVWRVAGYDIK